MNHAERLKIADHIVQQVVGKYKKEILLAGLCGSTARNEDLEFSDIELLFITTNTSRLRGKDFLFRDIQIALAFTRLRDVHRMLERVDLSWPLNVSRFFCISKIWGDQKILHDFPSLIQKIPKKKFTEALKENIPPLIDLVNKIQNAQREESLHGAVAYAQQLLYDINLSLGLLNRKYFTRNYYKNFEEAFSFEKLPSDYESLVKKLWVSKNIQVIAALSQKLLMNYLDLLKKNAITQQKYTSLDEIPLETL